MAKLKTTVTTNVLVHLPVTAEVEFDTERGVVISKGPWELAGAPVLPPRCEIDENLLDVDDLALASLLSSGDLPIPKADTPMVFRDVEQQLDPEMLPDDPSPEEYVYALRPVRALPRAHRRGRRKARLR
jgi:hypothetical protein